MKQNPKQYGLLFGTIACLLVNSVGADPVKIDLLVAYDTTAAAWVTSNGQTFEEFASNSVTKVNEVVANSRLENDLVFRLVGVHVGDFTYDSASGLNGVLSAAVDDQSASWKALRNSRDTVAADIAIILVDTGNNSGHVGESVSMQPVVNGVRQWGTSFEAADQWFSTYFSDRAYGVCDITAVHNDYTMAHEIGHIMGAGHSELLDSTYSEPGPQLFQNSAALMYKGSDGQYYATVMGYSSTGSGDGVIYEVLPYFSSPTLLNPHTGEPLGDALHDNVSTLKSTYAIVSSFRTATGEEEGGQITPISPSTDEPIVSSGEFAEKTNISGVLKEHGEIVGVIQLTVGKTKKELSRVSGFVIGFDGKKKNIKSQNCPVSNHAGVATVTLDSEVKGFQTPLHIVLGADGRLSGGSIGDVIVENAEIGRLASDNPQFEIADSIPSEQGVNFMDKVSYNDNEFFLLPYAGHGQPISVVNGKWKVTTKAGRIKFKRDAQSDDYVLIVDAGKDGNQTNFAATKLTYTPKTGTFKGSFTAYAIVSAKLTRYRFDVFGIVANGTGVGRAICKKNGISVSVSVR